MSRSAEIRGRLERCLRLAATCLDYETSRSLLEHAEELRAAIKVAEQKEADEHHQ